MRTETALVVDVEDLLAQHGARKRVQVAEPVEGLSLDLARVADPLEFDLVLEAIEGDAIVVQGRISGPFVSTCRRCLEETAEVLSCDVTEVFRQPADVWEEGYVVVEEKVDLRPMVRDTVLLALPSDPLCEQDCLGLCPRCGSNRNTDPCDCTVEEGDMRWQALRDLLDRS